MKTLITVHGLIEYEDKYLMLKRSSNRSNPGYWNCVTGHVKEYETAEEAVIREIKEETNLEGEIVKTAEPLIHHNNDQRWVILAYLIKVEDISNLKVDTEESEEYCWIDSKDEKVDRFQGIKETFKALEIL